VKSGGMVRVWCARVGRKPGEGKVGTPRGQGTITFLGDGRVGVRPTVARAGEKGSSAVTLRGILSRLQLGTGQGQGRRFSHV